MVDGSHSVIARMRRGKYVPIPPEWRGKVTDRQTIRTRQSKMTRKRRNLLKPDADYAHRISGDKRLRSEARAPKVDEWPI